MKRLLCVLLCTILLIPLPGCWSRKEPKDLAVVDSVIYDVTDGGGYQVTLEIINPSGLDGSMGGSSGGGGNAKSPSIIMVGEGRTVPEALRQVSQSLEKVMFGGHNKVRFFTERFARQGMAPIQDYLLRDHLTDETPIMAVLKSPDPQRIYESGNTSLSNLVGDYIDYIFRTQPEATSKSAYIDALHYIKDSYAEGKQPVMGLVELKESPKTSRNAGADAIQSDQGGSDAKCQIVFEGLAAFRDDKLAGYMDGTGARAYNIITGNLRTSYVSIPSGNDYTVFKINRSGADIQADVANGRATFDVKIKMDTTVIQEGDKTDITKPGPLKSAEDGFNRQMETEIKEAVLQAQQEFKSDIFGFGSYVHIQHPEKWKEMKESWDDIYFPGATVNVTVESSATRAGELEEPYQMEGD